MPLPWRSFLCSLARQQTKKTCCHQQVFLFACEMNKALTTQGMNSSPMMKVTTPIRCCWVNTAFQAGILRKPLVTRSYTNSGWVRGGLEFGCLARVGTVAVAVAALAIPYLLACFDIGRVFHHGRCEHRNRFIAGGSSSFL